MGLAVLFSVPAGCLSPRCLPGFWCWKKRSCGTAGTTTARSCDLTQCEVAHTASGRRVPLQRRNQLWQSLGGGGTVSARSLECEVVHTASGRRVPLQRRNQLWQSLGGTVSAARSLECEVVHTASGRRMALQWRNQFWQSLAEGAGNRAFQCLGFLTCALMLMHTCDCTRGLYGHSKSICIGR